MFRKVTLVLVALALVFSSVEASGMKKLSERIDAMFPGLKNPGGPKLNMPIIADPYLQGEEGMAEAKRIRNILKNEPFAALNPPAITLDEEILEAANEYTLKGKGPKVSGPPAKKKKVSMDQQVLNEVDRIGKEMSKPFKVVYYDLR